MTKLTEAQSRVLQGSQTIMVSVLTGSVWMSDAQGYTIQVRRPTFDKLVKIGFLEMESSDGQTELYVQTEAAAEYRNQGSPSFR